MIQQQTIYEGKGEKIRDNIGVADYTYKVDGYPVPNCFMDYHSVENNEKVQRWKKICGKKLLPGTLYVPCKHVSIVGKSQWQEYNGKFCSSHLCFSKATEKNI